MAVKLILEAAGNLLPTNHDYQNIERPNLFPIGWAVLYFAPN